MDFYTLKSRLSALEGRISQFSQPLTNMGIPFFSYVRVYKENSFLFLCNQPEWYQIQHENKLYDFNGFVPTLTLRPNLFTKVLSTGQPNPKNRFFSALYEAGIWNSINYCSYTKDYIESVHFGGRRESSLNLNHSEFFVKVIHGFRYIFTDLVDPPDPSLLVPLNDCFKAPIPDITSFPSVSLLEPSLPLTIHQKPLLLSRRQVDCLASLLRGATAKETAQKLNLSFRTVEFYHKLLKKKFYPMSLSNVLHSLSYQEISYILSHEESRHAIEESASLLKKRA